MPSGPLIPGVSEFDRPKRGFPRWAGYLIAVVVVVGGGLTLWGFVAGGGPLGGLGEVEEQLQPTGFRPTVEPDLIQIQVSLPNEGACPSNTFDITALESAESINVEVNLLRPRSNSCPGQLLTDSLWLDLALADPLGERLILRSIDGQELPRVR